MSNEPITGQPYQQEGSKQTDAVQNSTLNFFAAWTNCWVLSVGATAPPGSPANGDRHIVGTAATGAWATHDDQLAVYRDGWQFYAPPASGAVTVYNMDDHSEWRYDAGWATAPAGGDVSGPASSVDLRIAVFDGITGKSLKDGGKTIAEIGNDHPINAQTGTSYAILAGDRGKHLTLSNASSIAVTIAQAGTTGFEDGFFTFFEVLGAGAVTITPTTSTINGAATLVLNSGMSGILFSDGTNYRVMLLERSGIVVNPQTGTSYTYLSDDRGKLVSHSNAAAIAGTLPQANGAFGARWFTYVQNVGAGTLTITPTTSTIDGASSLALTTGQGVLIASDGTNYYTMRGMATGGGGGGGGLTNFTEGVNTSTPNATSPYVYLSATNAAARVDVAISPKAGAFSAQVADNATTGGNKRGVGAWDMQSSRTSQIQVASGTNSFVGVGISNRASAANAATVGGNGSAASGVNSITLGGNGASASGDASVAHGTGSNTKQVENARAFGCLAGKQFFELSLGVSTTNATPTVLRSNASGASATNQYAFSSNQSGYALLLINARQTAGSGTVGDCAGWLYLVLVKNVGGALTLVGTPTLLGSHSDANAATWVATPGADNTNKALSVTGTGEAGKTIQWSAALLSTET